MKSSLIHRILLPTCLAVLTAPHLTAGQSVYATSSRFGEIVRLDRDTGALLERNQLSFLADDPSSPEYFGATAHPVSGLIYVIVDNPPVFPILATLDPSDATFSAVGSLGEIRDPGNSPSLTFGPAPDYPLYLITGGGGNNSPERTVYNVDSTTGEATALPWVTSGVGAHAVEYNPSDGFLYHFYNTSDSGGGSPGLEKINLTTGVATPVALSGTLYGRANAVAYLAGNFYVHDKVDETLYSVTLAGVSTLIGSTSDDFLNLSAIGTSLYAVNRNPSELKEINPATGADIGTMSLGPVPNRMDVKSMALDPITGILYGLGDAPFPATPGADSRLFQIDPLTGKVSNSVTLAASNFGSITFADDGTLYGITRQATDPGDLPNETFATINPSDGTHVETGWATSQAPLLVISPSLEFNSTDGLLYYTWDTGAVTKWRSIDPSNGNITELGQIGVRTDTLTYDAKREVFYVSGNTQLTSLTSAGVQTFIGEPVVVLPREWEFEVVPDLRITGFSVSSSNASISFESVPNREYGLYSSTDLNTFDPVPGFETIQADAPENTETNVPLPAADKGFYRLGPPSGN